MAVIKDDILALRTLIASHLPATTRYHLQDVPESPVAGSLAIRLTNQTSAEFTGAATRIERIYQLIYFGKTNIDVIDTADTIRRLVSKQTKLAVGSDYSTLGSLGLSQPFKTESGLDAAIFVLPMTFVEHREVDDVPKMDEIRIITAPQAPSDGEAPGETVRIPIQVPCSPLDTLNITKDMTVVEMTPIYTAEYKRVNDGVTAGESSI